MTDAIAHITVGVADIERALRLWRDTFGMEVVGQRDGPDEALAALWGLGPGGIAAQALIRTPGTTAGWLHLVEFADPAALGPKNLDVYCDDIHARVTDLRQDGWEFRSRVVDYSIGDIEASEVQMPGPDETNIVFVHVAGQAMPFSTCGYAGVTSLVVIVPDLDAEVDFYRDTFGFDELIRHRIGGAEVEEMIGLPAQTGLELSLLGRAEQLFGRVELIRYDGAPGADRFALACAPALGSLHCAFRVESVDATLARYAGDGERHEDLRTLFADGDVGVLRSPAGMRVEVYGA
jgi:catechol 2,3-dioxygenase-like lactoylglutathione lyase family enzyme